MPIPLRRALPFGRAVFPLMLATLLVTASLAQDVSGRRPEADSASAEKGKGKAETRPGGAPDSLVQLNAALEGLADKVSQGVVQILVTGYGPLEEGGRTETAFIARQRAIGSGVIVDPSGYVMTNAHVVEGARRIRVVLPVPLSEGARLEPEGKRRILEAKLIGVHQETDLALLKVSAKELPALPLESGSRVRQGQLVFAVGSPEGLQNTITMGVVSSVARQPDPNKGMVYIQTDAPINPGNSGGPLVDMDGHVVGINTFILSGSGGSEGIGFAIPARIVRFVYESLRRYGHVHRSEIEAGAQTITPSLAAGLGLKRSWGVLISDVKPGGPAEAAGLKIGDIVLAADDRTIDTLPAFTGAMYLHPADKALKLDVLRETERKTLLIPVLQQKHPEAPYGSVARSCRSADQPGASTGNSGDCHRRPDSSRGRRSTVVLRRHRAGTGGGSVRSRYRSHHWRRDPCHQQSPAGHGRKFAERAFTTQVRRFGRAAGGAPGQTSIYRVRVGLAA